MKKMLIFNIALAFLPILALAQLSPEKTTRHPIKFRLDDEKPYVYLQLDHIGPRQPRSTDEPKMGLWLRLHNNCAVPITIRTFGVPQGSEAGEIGVFDSVVANPPSGTGDGSFSYDRWPVVMPDVGLPSASGAPQKASSDSASSSLPPDRRAELEEMPHGYMFAISSLTTIEPGQSIYFSLPVNHVRKTWHLEIPFKLALRGHGADREPYSYVAFFWDELPEAYRTAQDSHQEPDLHER